MIHQASKISKLKQAPNLLMAMFRSRLVFNYQACVDIKGSQSQREEAQVRLFPGTRLIIIIINNYDDDDDICDNTFDDTDDDFHYASYIFNHANDTFDDGRDDKKLLSQCLAHWKEGSTYYFVAMMNSSHVDRQQLESSFRLAL